MVPLSERSEFAGAEGSGEGQPKAGFEKKKKYYFFRGNNIVFTTHGRTAPIEEGTTFRLPRTASRPSSGRRRGSAWQGRRCIEPTNMNVYLNL